MPEERFCIDCQYHDPLIPDVSGRCKKDRIERHTSGRDIVNGWPEVKPTEKPCGDFELRV